MYNDVIDHWNRQRTNSVAISDYQFFLNPFMLFPHKIYPVNSEVKRIKGQMIKKLDQYFLVLYNYRYKRLNQKIRKEMAAQLAT